ncbi:MULTISPECIES: ankyrin repeat domain-containing protein [Chryseobacterium]|uniref:ankyrin repeat domain-containing protein n=1 Tax=Chryseobacterium TaxID=59732 RepID=UPI000FADDF47|nr:MULTISPECIES: ankyrin repeat domain-containing protein [Chryseobacterium]MBM7418626.1 ankyrin repeat protein [Chryseobacterium sp. JUb44]MDH6208536.1 ankyrin repeat protein [Chryseobacterium sp. BIGb0186]MDY0932227.1 ankyrin repeat domain-containing protein [Chryseobacterium sp. CFBP8996]WSO11424.1 ankyrin repeat domain-containing protein [Chryseobacterium scophthalmum]
MRKIITTTLLFGIAIFSNGLFAQELSGDKMRIFQTDKIEDVKKVFKKDELTKCFDIKEVPYNLLSLSARYERVNVINYLFTNNVDVNKSCSDTTPLMYAAMYGYTDTVKLFLKKGAKKEVKDRNGKTAKDHALENKHPETAALL